jgi:3-hydroxymyristoyl/3-hydroxydecanoyl-(acyl carrier protein) dehydratase
MPFSIRCTDSSAFTNWEKISEKDFEGLDLAGSVGYLAEIRNVKFMSLVKPGDTLELHAKKGASMGRLMQIKVFAKVGNATVVEGMLTVSVGR